MKRLLVLSLIIIIMLPLSAAREEDIDLKLSLEDIGKVEIGFSSSAIESWTDNASTVSEVTLEPKTDGKAYLEQDLYAYAKVQSNYPGHIYLISDELIGYKDEILKSNEVEEAKLGWIVNMADISDDEKSNVYVFSAERGDDLSDEPVFSHDLTVSPIVQIYNAKAEIWTEGNYFDLLDTGARYWEQNLKLVWKTE